ncbi:TylF/MycF/NovP-related O-methyltransferase [Actinokineospora sp. 24-640]
MDSSREMYLDLLKRTVTNTIYEDPPIPTPWRPDDTFDLATRELGRDWPSQAHSMIGFRRLENLRTLVESVLADGVPGDLLEAGVARGGAMVYARGVLLAHGVTDRVVWLADSFQGFPEPSAEQMQPLETFYPELAEDFEKFQDAMAGREVTGDDLYGQFLVGTSEQEVRDTFERYGLLDGQVRFLPGWFDDTLPAAPVERLAVLRVDADLYDSTHVALEALYPKVSPGGYVIIDDYQSVDQCRRAVHDYLKSVEEDPKLEVIDEDAVYWRKARA